MTEDLKQQIETPEFHVDPDDHLKVDIFDGRGNSHRHYKDAAAELVGTGNYSYEWPPKKKEVKKEETKSVKKKHKKA